jgi:hypothetical protein
MHDIQRFAIARVTSRLEERVICLMKKDTPSTVMIPCEHGAFSIALFCWAAAALSPMGLRQTCCPIAASAPFTDSKS